MLSVLFASGLDQAQEAASSVHTSGVNPESAAAIIGGLAALLTVAGLLYRWLIAPGRILARQQADKETVAAVLGAIGTQIDPILATLTKNNGGSSVKDRFDALDRSLSAIQVTQSAQAEKLSTVGEDVAHQKGQIEGILARLPEGAAKQ